MQLTANLADAAATEALGSALADAYVAAGRSGVVYLSGDLGAGKTTCVRGLLRRLGVSGLVRSPTYTLLETYEVAAHTLVHVDLYRLRAASEAEDLALRDLLDTEYLLLIEWPEKGGRVLPAADLELSLSYEGSGRLAVLSARSSLGEAWLTDLRRDSKFNPYVSNLT